MAAAGPGGLPALGQVAGGAAGESWHGPAAGRPIPDVLTPDAKALGTKAAFNARLHPPLPRCAPG